MVQQADIEHVQSVCDGLCRLDVGRGGFGVAHRVVVKQNHGCCIAQQGVANNVAGLDVDRSETATKHECVLEDVV